MENEKKKKKSPFFPVFEAIDTFLFETPVKTVNAPFGRDPINVKRYMLLVIVALFPCFLASLYFFGYRIVLMIAVSYIAGGLVEVVFAIVRKHEINEGFLVTGFIFPLVLPPGLPLWLVAAGAAFGVLIGKEVFGGTGRNLFNPALVGRCFLLLGYPSVMAESWIVPSSGAWGNLLDFNSFFTVDAVSSATPLVGAKSQSFLPLFDLVIGRTLGSAGETSEIAILAGCIILLVTKIASFRVIAGIVLSASATYLAIQLVSPASAVPLVYGLASGGLLFGAVFMATDPVSSPLTLKGKWIYGITIGVLAVLIRSFSGYVEGMMFAILLGNIFAPTIDEAVLRLKMRVYSREK